MNDQLKKQGWSQMNDLLDQHMPANKNKNRIPLWFLLFLPLSFAIGYMVHDKYNGRKKHTTPYPASQFAEARYNNSINTAKKVNDNAVTKNMSPNVQTTIPAGTTKRFKQTLTGTTLNNIVFEQSAFDKSFFAENGNNPNPELPVTDQNDTNVPPISETFISTTNKNDLLPAVDQHVFNISFLQSQQISGISPAVSMTGTQKSNLRHAVTLSLGTNPMINKSSTYGISYDLACSFGKWSLGASLGYRYADFKFSQIIDTMSMRQYNQNIQTGSVFTLNHSHHIIPGLVMSYDLTKKLGLTAGVDFPFLLISQKHTLEVLSSSESMLDAGNATTQDPQILIRKENINHFHKSDIQAKIGFLYHLSERINLAGIYRHGIIPMNNISLNDGKNLLWRQISVDMSYIF